MGPKRPDQQPSSPSPEPNDQHGRWRRLVHQLRRRRPNPTASKSPSEPTPPPAVNHSSSAPVRDYRHVKTIPFVLESRYRTINAAILLIVVACVIAVASPAARQVVGDHATLLSGLGRLITENAQITAVILASFAGRVGWTAWKDRRDR